ncbi:MAG: tRNA-dihydrouridine synthase family protein [Bacteroidales bacterium]|nr:tRNA-dihydrouridine synthase family protein [Bacteroidales bacterium]
MILAPMQGLTELLFRRAYQRTFPGAIRQAVAPFISLTAGNPSHTASKAMLDVEPRHNEGSIPVVPQILGNDPQQMLALADILAGMGYREVNWNIGCPMRRIAAKQRGSGILPHPDRIGAILDAVCGHMPLQLSVKMRLGHQSPDDIFKIIPLLNSHPLASVTIHPRTGKQLYSGHPDIERFAQALPLIEHPVVYNGDITTLAQYRTITSRFNTVSDIMIGRGILLNPTLSLQIDAGEPLPDDIRLQLSHKFLDNLISDILQQPMHDESKLRKIKEYWALVHHSIDLPELSARQLLRINTLPDLTKAISSLSATTVF